MTLPSRRHASTRCGLIGLSVAASVLGCSPPGQPPRPMVIDSAAVRKGVFAFMQQAADAAGTLDPVAALAGAPADSSIIWHKTTLR